MTCPNKPVKIIKRDLPGYEGCTTGGDPGSEKVIERKLNEWIKASKGHCFKLSSEFHKGLPDRMVMLPGGKLFFCELKSIGKKPDTFQKIVHNTMRKLGFRVYVIDNLSDLYDMLKKELLE